MALQNAENGSTVIINSMTWLGQDALVLACSIYTAEAPDHEVCRALGLETHMTLTSCPPRLAQ
jgi:hypothetical protein